jgi:hypothetical protein
MIPMRNIYRERRMPFLYQSIDYTNTNTNTNTNTIAIVILIQLLH